MNDPWQDALEEGIRRIELARDKLSLEEAISRYLVIGAYGDDEYELAISDREICLDAARRYQQIKAAVDAGTLALVPLYPSINMKNAGRQSFREQGLLPAFTDEGISGQQPIIQMMLDKVYKAMLSAAPKSELLGD